MKWEFSNEEIQMTNRRKKKNTQHPIHQGSEYCKCIAIHLTLFRMIAINYDAEAVGEGSRYSLQVQMQIK